MGNLTVSLAGVVEYSNYRRKLDLDTGVHTTSWTTSETTFETAVFCSYPAKSCVYTISGGSNLPAVTISLGNELMSADLINVTCGTGYTRLRGITQASIGLQFDSVARATGNISSSCSETGSLTVTPAAGQSTVTIVFSAESNFDQTKGNAENNFSFRGEDPGPIVEATTALAAARTDEDLLFDHIQDYSSLMGLFNLTIPDTADSSIVETSELVARYTKGTADPFLESLMFDYSRHLLVSSSREGSLPANLQGRWTEQTSPAWSADYHANINIQMNYWGADATGLTSLSRPVFEYMVQNWAPRGSETAQLLYNGSGWVVHNEMNIFGYTGMKNDAQWANCKPSIRSPAVHELALISPPQTLPRQCG